MIQIGELIVVGKTYHSRCGNVVRLTGSKEAIVKGKRVTQFRGQIIETIPGHEILLNKTHWFDEKGKWLQYPGGIHDLVKLCDDHK